ncbi:pilus assembly PilX family protein [Tahibacter amnicola]|uniref:PilX N-terminal domain-containing pilus assembly protein n=1 Tax=Tahibacter amnicola TaxID=2976241 RepID=A0ABY6BAZ2_9GAMM|nr:PilX N-terminal domain-containing pilus assembly protein [Tahibacter amnicola]UXI66320.1 PilX N-terminal domain-containing pilus assembly protein [Tahibacter amnicola]
MHSRHLAPIAPVRRQSGAVLFVSLMILILMMLLTLAAARMTAIQERLAGSFKNHHDAFESAELQLVSGEGVVVDPLRQPDVAFATIADDTTTPWYGWYAEGPETPVESVHRVRIGQSLKFGTDPLREPKFFVVSAGAPGKDTTATAAVQSTYVY